MNAYERWQTIQANARPTGERLPTERIKDFAAISRIANIEREWEEREYQDAIASVLERHKASGMEKVTKQKGEL